MPGLPWNLPGPDGRRPCFGDDLLQQDDPHFREHLLFHEYFHGDSGRGLGAAHQTGWTALVGMLVGPRAGHVATGVEETRESR